MEASIGHSQEEKTLNFNDKIIESTGVNSAIESIIDKASLPKRNKKRLKKNEDFLWY